MFKKINLDRPIMYLAPETKSGNLSPIDLTKYCLNRIEKFNSYLKTFITVEKECALEDAYCVEKEIKKRKLDKYVIKFEIYFSLHLFYFFYFFNTL